MPRRRTSRRNRRSSRNGGSFRGPLTIQGNGQTSDRVVTVNASGYFSVTPSVPGVTILTLNTLATSGFSERLLTIASAFELCRCVYLEVSFQAGVYDALVGYSSFEEAVPINTYQRLSEAANVSINFAGVTVPSRLVLNRRLLLGFNPLKWFPTVQTTGTTSFDQGQLLFAVAAATSIRVRFSTTFEFCVPVYTGYSVPLPEGFACPQSASTQEAESKVESPVVVSNHFSTLPSSSSSSTVQSVRRLARSESKV